MTHGSWGDPSGGHDAQGEEPRVVVRDKRRVDTQGGLREPDPDPGAPVAAAPDPAPGAGAPADVPVAAEDPRVAELTDTLQRLKAEYDNYRRRVERDRQAVVDTATAGVLAAFLPVLDDIERARTHGDLTGAFGAVGDALVATSTKLGLESFGAAGDPFDPQLHEAVMAAAPSNVPEPVAAEVFRPGYRFAGRVLRAAQVTVSDPLVPTPSGAAASAGDEPAGEEPVAGRFGPGSAPSA